MFILSKGHIFSYLFRHSPMATLGIPPQLPLQLNVYIILLIVWTENISEATKSHDHYGKRTTEKAANAEPRWKTTDPFDYLIHSTAAPKKSPAKFFLPPSAFRPPGYCHFIHDTKKRRQQKPATERTQKKTTVGIAGKAYTLTDDTLHQLLFLFTYVFYFLFKSCASSLQLCSFKLIAKTNI